MDTIIGLGKGGCNIAKNFGQYPQYNTICIDTEDAGHDNFLQLPEQKCHEDYERYYGGLDLSACRDHVGVFCVGAGRISGAILRILEQIKDKRVWVYFIKADPTDISDRGKLRERATFFILQEFARCGLIDRIYLLENKKIEEYLEEVSIFNYWDKLNETISSTVHMLNYFRHADPVMSTFTSVHEAAKIQTIGFLDSKTGEEKLFYDLQFPRHRLYYYAIEEDKLKKEGKLLSKIKKQVKSATTERCATNYGIYATQYKQDYCYVELFSSFIQEQDLPER